METGLAGKRVLVTGASGGIGSACARAFAGEGCRVVLHYNQGRERADALAAELEDSVLVQADLTREEEADELFDRVQAELGGLDVCAAVAGVWPEEDAPSGNCRSSVGTRLSLPTSPQPFSRHAASCARSSARATAASSSSARRQESSARRGTRITPPPSRP